MPELRNEDTASFFNFLRMPPVMFDELLARLVPLITKQDTNYRNAIEPGLKLAMTIRHLATGDRYASMKFDFRVSHNTISLCVREVSLMSTRTSASSVQPLLRNDEQFPQNLGDGTCLMRAVHLMGL